MNEDDFSDLNNLNVSDVVQFDDKFPISNLRPRINVSKYAKIVVGCLLFILVLNLIWFKVIISNDFICTKLILNKTNSMVFISDIEENESNVKFNYNGKVKTLKFTKDSPNDSDYKVFRLLEGNVVKSDMSSVLEFKDLPNFRIYVSDIIKSVIFELNENTMSEESESSFTYKTLSNSVECRYYKFSESESIVEIYNPNIKEGEVCFNSDFEIVEMSESQFVVNLNLVNQSIAIPNDLEVEDFISALDKYLSEN